MKKINYVALFMVFFVANNAYTQISTEKYQWKSREEFNVQMGLQDPFLKPDGSRVKSQNEWPEQRKYIIAMLEHYQYGKRPPTPKDVTVKETFSKDTLDGTATRKLYTMTINRNGKSLDFHFGLLKPKGNGPFPVIIKNGDISIEIDPKSESHGIPPEIFLQAIKRGYIICE